MPEYSLGLVLPWLDSTVSAELSRGHAQVFIRLTLQPGSQQPSCLLPDLSPPSSPRKGGAECVSAGFTALQLLQKVLQLPTREKEIELKEISNLYNKVARRLFMLNVKYSKSQPHIKCILPLLQIPGVPQYKLGALAGMS